MGALLGGGEALPIDNAGMMSGATPVAGSADMLGKLAAQGGSDPNMAGPPDAMSPAAGQIAGLLQNLNPVQQVGLQGLLGALNPMRGAQQATPTGQQLPVASAAPSNLPQANPPSTPIMPNSAVPGGGLGGAGTASGGIGAGANAGRIMKQMQQSSQSREPEQTPQPQTTSNMVPPVSQPPQMAYDWSGFRAQSRDAMQGMQQMPYVFSGYNQMNGQNVSDIMKMFYPGWSPSGPAQKPDEAGTSPGQGVGDPLQIWGY